MSARARLLEGERAIEDTLADVSATIRLILDCVRLLEEPVALAQRAQLQEAQKHLVLAASALDIAALIDGGVPSDDDLETLP